MHVSGLQFLEIAGWPTMARIEAALRASSLAGSSRGAAAAALFAGGHDALRARCWKVAQA